jgi:hypothetical protein
MLRRLALAVLLIAARDEDPPRTIPPDAEAPADPGLAIEIPDVDAYVGDRAELSATASRRIAVSYQWKVARAPTGSAINDASLAGATSPTPSFVPDVAGEYRPARLFTKRHLSGSSAPSVSSSARTRHHAVRAYESVGFVRCEEITGVMRA